VLSVGCFEPGKGSILLPADALRVYVEEKNPEFRRAGRAETSLQAVSLPGKTRHSAV
jgi:hypothetical protein